MPTGIFLWPWGHIAFWGPTQHFTGIVNGGKNVSIGGCAAKWGCSKGPQNVWARALNAAQLQGCCCGGGGALQLGGLQIYRNHLNCAMAIIKVFKLQNKAAAPAPK